jgi:hypothetical protein
MSSPVSAPTGPTRRFLLAAVTGLLLIVLIAGCGGDDEAATTTTARATTVAPTTTVPTTTTTTAPALGFAAGEVAAPLTGLGMDETLVSNQAIVLKIDNHKDARPQTGIDAADIVFDYRAEGVTRFAAVFHSQLPDEVGPVRSSRTADFDIVSGFGHPVYGSSGGNDTVIATLNSVPVFAMTNQTRHEYYRGGPHAAPHNLYVRPAELYAAAEAAYGADLVDLDGPLAWFDYALPGEAPSTGEPVTGPVTIDFTGEPTVTFEWDSATGAWPRSMDGAPHETTDGVRIAPANVVIMFTTYGTSAADPKSPEVVSVGSGEAIVLTGGQAIRGTWERGSATGTPTLVDAAGAPIVLTAGQTWILYPEPGQVTL